MSELEKPPLQQPPAEAQGPGDSVSPDTSTLQPIAPDWAYEEPQTEDPVLSGKVGRMGSRRRKTPRGLEKPKVLSGVQIHDQAFVEEFLRKKAERRAKTAQPPAEIFKDGDTVVFQAVASNSYSMKKKRSRKAPPTSDSGEHEIIAPVQVAEEIEDGSPVVTQPEHSFSPSADDGNTPAYNPVEQAYASTAESMEAQQYYAPPPPPMPQPEDNVLPSETSSLPPPPPPPVQMSYQPVEEYSEAVRSDVALPEQSFQAQQYASSGPYDTGTPLADPPPLPPPPPPAQSLAEGEMQIQDYGEGEQYMQAFPQPAFNESAPQVSYREPEDSQKHAEVLEVPSPESPHGVEPEISHTFENEPVAPTQALYEVNDGQMLHGAEAEIASKGSEADGDSSSGEVGGWTGKAAEIAYQPDPENATAANEPGIDPMDAAAELFKHQNFEPMIPPSEEPALRPVTEPVAEHPSVLSSAGQSEAVHAEVSFEADQLQDESSPVEQPAFENAPDNTTGVTALSSELGAPDKVEAEHGLAEGSMMAEAASWIQPETAPVSHISDESSRSTEMVYLQKPVTDEHGTDQPLQYTQALPEQEHNFEDTAAHNTPHTTDGVPDAAVEAAAFEEERLSYTHEQPANVTESREYMQEQAHDDGLAEEMAASSFDGETIQAHSAQRIGATAAQAETPDGGPEVTAVGGAIQAPHSAETVQPENGRPRIRIPWDENAVQELAYGERDSLDRSYTEASPTAYAAENGEQVKSEYPERTHYAQRAAGADREQPIPAMTGGNMHGNMNGGRVTPGPGGSGGAWLWLPQGVEERRSWGKRHPILFWGAILLFAALLFNAGRLSMSDIPLGGTKLAVINLDGIILDSESMVKWIEIVAKDDTYKGALVRINSPGGAVGPSQEIYAALKRLDAKKPVVASMGTLAASGGYYVALGAREIIAGPSTITGSIGVKMQVPNVEGLMGTLGVSSRTLVSGAYKDAGSPWRQMSREEEEYFYGIMDDMYEEFVGVIAHERKISMVDMANIADGKAMTGRQAMLLKLVDGLGDKHDALSRLKTLCKIDENTHVGLVEGPRSKSSMLKEFLLSIQNMLQEHQSVSVQPMFIY